MHHQKDPECVRSAPGFWLLLLGPAAFAIWTVLYFQGEIRGASLVLQMLLLVPTALAGWGMYSLRSFFRTIAEEYHWIAASALLASAFFTIWALGTVPMEEIYIIFDGYEGRRIYSDDSGTGYAIGLGNVLTATAAALFCGLVFGVVWGVITSILRKVSFDGPPARGA